VCCAFVANSNTNNVCAWFTLDNNFTSFQRQLNLYGFKRLRFNTAGSENNELLAGVVLGIFGSAGGYKGTYIYSHPLFVFNRRELCDNIRRVPVTPSGKNSNNTRGQGAIKGDDLRGMSGEAESDDIYNVLLSMKESVPTSVGAPSSTSAATPSSQSLGTAMNHSDLEQTSNKKLDVSNSTVEATSESMHVDVPVHQVHQVHGIGINNH